MSTAPTIWLRAESKAYEERTSLTPAGAAALVGEGIRVIVEHSQARIFPDGDYASAGCSLVDAGLWKSAPSDAFILGLKELPDSAQSLHHRHIYFAHAFKCQPGWRDLLSRFQRGGGTLYDLEYLVDANGRRVAAFGYWAGFSGAGTAALAWAGQSCEEVPALASLMSYPGRDELLDHCRQLLSHCSEVPRVLIIGAAGRCGGGATELFREMNADITLWDIEETKNGGPFEQILEHDIFVNCVFVSTHIPPFLTPELLDRERKLSVICDVSCDPSGDLNPLPVYDRCTTFADPLQRVVTGENPLDLIAIDHLPSLLPKESSEDFSNQLLPHLLNLFDSSNDVWLSARSQFEQMLEEL